MQTSFRVIAAVAVDRLPRRRPSRPLGRSPAPDARQAHPCRGIGFAPMNRATLEWYELLAPRPRSGSPAIVLLLSVDRRDRRSPAPRPPCRSSPTSSSRAGASPPRGPRRRPHRRRPARRRRRDPPAAGRRAARRARPGARGLEPRRRQAELRRPSRSSCRSPEHSVASAHRDAQARAAVSDAARPGPSPGRPQGRRGRSSRATRSPASSARSRSAST